MVELNKNELLKLDKDKLVKKILSMAHENKEVKKKNASLLKEVEVLNKQIMNEKVFIVNKEIYDKYDLTQKNNETDIEMKPPINNEECEKLFKQFNKYVSQINTLCENNINENNIIEGIKIQFLGKNEINDIVNYINLG